ncbi:MAG TPA: carbamoyltransferase [Methylomirabilota bacterium]|nr:carbamoyltransferase [Methylomirabilota bacterium]
MDILGLSCYYHDAAAVLLRDGVLVAAAEEERFTGIKHDYAFPARAIAFCLREGGITARDLDHVVFYEKPFLKFERLLFSIMATFPRSSRVFREAMITWLGDKLWIKSLIREQLGVDREKILFSEHHLSHAASALFCSPYREAAILTVDGVGEWTTATMGRGSADWDGSGRNEITLGQELRFPHSLGMLYSVFTAFLGFEVNEGEYKVMGMAPYGEPKYVDRVRRLVDIAPDGSFHLDMSYFSYHHHPEQSYRAKFLGLFGEPRPPRARFVTRQTSLYDDPSPPSAEELRRNQYYADVAASIQRVTEDILLAMANQLYRDTGLPRLCIAGGVGLNSVANYKILRQTPFEEIFIQPAAGDSGGALGAALYAYHVLLQKPRRFVLDHAYWGETFPADAIEADLEQTGSPYELIRDDDKLFERVVDALLAGKVVGWYQGRFEWGPRALGNRSILADPRQERMKDIVNIKIKFREPFRPFAPSVLVDATERYFDIAEPARHHPARFMLYVVPVTRPDAIPAVTHVDGSGRLQTVHRDLAPRYARLIETFGEASGVPAVLNTSFNLKGEPIVRTPAEAIRTFQKSEMDLLVMENYLLAKSAR